MKKEHFEYGSQKYCIVNKYVFESEEYVLVIDEEIFDEETIEYVNNIVQKYLNEREKILNYMLDIRLRSFYNLKYNYSDEYIKRNIGKPQINIFMKKDNSHPNWKFEYYGSIDFLENTLDEHVITIDFMDDLNLDKEIKMNG